MASDRFSSSWRGICLVMVGGGAFFAGAWLAVPGLIWSRWLRPFDRTAQAGYYLCWIALTTGPVLYELGFVQSHDVGQWWLAQLAAYGICAGIWLLVRKKFVNRPASSIARAVLIAICGTLLTAPTFLPMSTTLPLVAGIAAMIPLSNQSAGAAWALWTILLLEACRVFPAYLAVYWPAQKTGSGSSN